MSKVVVINHVTLDGVMQAPGRAEEDTRDGFTHGGWGNQNVDDQLVAATYARVEEGGGLQLLLGRRRYEGMLSYWNTQDSPFKEGLNNAHKYVASRTLGEPLPWPNSTLLRGDVGDAVTELKRKLSGDLTVMGSGESHPDADARQPDRRVPAVHPPTRPRHRPGALQRREPAGVAQPHRERDHTSSGCSFGVRERSALRLRCDRGDDADPRNPALEAARVQPGQQEGHLSAAAISRCDPS